MNTILSEEGNGLKVEECGLFVDTAIGYLAATPDGTVGQDSLVEVKCPMKCLENKMEDLARNDSTFCLEMTGKGKTGLRLKKNHNYYYQIQGQLHIAKRYRRF